MSPKEYYLYVYSRAGLIDLKQVHNSYPDAECKRLDHECLQIELAPERLLYVFLFGSVVFLGVPEQEHPQHLIKIGFDEVKARRLRQGEDFAEDDYLLKIVPGENKVGFNSVVLPEWDEAKIGIVCRVLAESSALEVIEDQVAENVEAAGGMTNAIKRSGSIRQTRREVLRFMGENLSTRHTILHRLSLLHEPDLSWEVEQIHKLNANLVENFDIKARVAVVEKMLELSSEVSSLQLDTLNAKRTEFLEIIIIVLIAVEIIQTLISY